MNDPQVITAQAAAELLGISVGTLYERAKTGVIEVKKVNGRWIFIRDELIAWLRSKD